MTALGSVARSILNLCGMLLLAWYRLQLNKSKLTKWDKKEDGDVKAQPQFIEEQNPAGAAYAYTAGAVHLERVQGGAQSSSCMVVVLDSSELTALLTRRLCQGSNYSLAVCVMGVVHIPPHSSLPSGPLMRLVWKVYCSGQIVPRPEIFGSTRAVD